MSAIPKVPPEGWTTHYLRQLRAIADEVQPHPSLEEYKQDRLLCERLTEDQLDELSDATADSFHEFERVERIMQGDRQSPEKWVDYLVASRRHIWHTMETARRLFGELS